MKHSNILSPSFKITNGVKQDCVLALHLVRMMLQHYTEDIDYENDVYIWFRTDGGLFNLRRLQPHKDQGETDHAAIVR